MASAPTCAILAPGEHRPEGDTGVSVPDDGERDRDTISVTVPIQGRSLRLRGDQEFTIGRSPNCAIVLNDPGVSRLHARVQRVGANWRILDAGSANGTWHDGVQVDQISVAGERVSVRVGGWHDGIELIFDPPATHREAARLHPLHAGRMRLGRALDNEIVLPDLLISRHHAELVIGPNGIQLTDLGSANGTFVDGRPVNSAPLRVGETIAIGPFQLHFDGTSLHERVDSGDIVFGAAGLTVDVSGRRLLDDVGFSLGPRTLMAVVGPSGAGKSTLLGTLTGLRPATSGSVAYAGRDLYRHYGELRQRIGFVPQDDILHTALTVEQALTFGAQLRFPADTSRQERGVRVREVAAELSLTERLGTPIARLSGGERKRASTALELLTRPSLLLLDEPTSGLDTDLDREVMTRLRSLADDGRTVVVVTHNLEHLDVCDVVMVLARGGHVAYLGPPAAAFDYFGARTWADVFAALKTSDGKQWAHRFRSWGRRSPASAPMPSIGRDSSSTPLTPLAPQRAPSPLAQLGTLIHRQVRVTLADRTLTTILLVLPAILAAITRVIPGQNGLARRAGNTDARQLLLVLIVGASLTGAATAVRELVKERAIYRRERAIGLSSGIYLTSKILVLGLIAMAQGAVLASLAMLGRPRASGALVLGSGSLEITVVVALVAAVSACLGLCISAAVRDENQAMPLLVLLSMAQLVLCGALVPVVDRPVLEQLSWLLPARWAFSATAATVGLTGMSLPTATPDPTWESSAATWWSDVGMLAALATLGVALGYLLLRRLDPRTKR